MPLGPEPLTAMVWYFSPSSTLSVSMFFRVPATSSAVGTLAKSAPRPLRSFGSSTTRDATGNESSNRDFAERRRR